MSVDLPAPFSPMRVCTSPGRSVRSTPSSAFTPGNSTVMPRSSATGAGVAPASAEARTMVSSVMRASFRGTAGDRTHPVPGGGVFSVGAGVQDLGGLLLREGLVLDDRRLLDVLA